MFSLFIQQAYAGDVPIAASEAAVRWDSLYHFLVWISVFFTVLVVGGMVYMAFKFKAQPGKKSKYVTGSHLLEAIWTIIPTVLLLVIFGWGYSVYNSMTKSPSDAYEIRVIAKQWLWNFQYDFGRTTVNELYVPVNKPVKLIMTSEDVLHSFFVPNFRIKQDVVPGMYTSVWFEATIPGKHQVFCAEYCGTSHSQMLAKVIALEPEQWEAWKKGKDLPEIPNAGMTLAETQAAAGGAQAAPKMSVLAMQGKKLTESKGCVACHSDDGTKKVGPSYKGVFGHEVELEGGSKVMADENYIRESILQPQAKIVKGFAGLVMPPFQGQLSETEINAIIEYIKALKE